jgi:hypothetical protein
MPSGSSTPPGGFPTTSSSTRRERQTRGDPTSGRGSAPSDEAIEYLQQRTAVLYSGPKRYALGAISQFA